MDCPVCSTPVSEAPVATYTSVQTARHFCSETRDADRNARLRATIERLWQGDTCQILNCTTCDFMFGVPYVAGDEAFYAILHEQQGYPAWRYEYDIALRATATADTPFRSALDIGAGSGAFLKALPAGWKRAAIEGSPVTREGLKQAGISAYGDLEEVPPSSDGTFHLVTLFQVLEHLAPFAGCLSACRRLVHSQGLLVISVPDAHAMLAQEKATGCPDCPPNHINKWTPASLTRALSSAGFEVRETTLERPSLHTLRSGLHQRLMTDATRPGTLADRVYRFRDRRLHIALLAGLSAFAAVRLVPHWRYFASGGSFTVVATPA